MRVKKWIGMASVFALTASMLFGCSSGEGTENGSGAAEETSAAEAAGETSGEEEKCSRRKHLAKRECHPLCSGSSGRRQRHDCPGCLPQTMNTVTGKQFCNY